MNIDFTGITKQFQQAGSRGQARTIQALTEINLHIERGEFFSIIGPSGCGKSTLLNLLAGLDTPTTGKVTVGGQVVTRPGPDRAVVFQEHGLMPWMTVSRNIEYGLKLQKVPRAERRERAEKFLRMVHLSRYADAMPHQLSGGMRQRVSIARALALEPKVLLMDEPFSALDAQTRDVLHDELQRIWEETRTTIVFVTHNIREAVYLSDRVMIMTSAPGSIKKIVNVPFAYPRQKNSADLGAFGAQLHDLIKAEVDKVAKRELDENWEQDLAAPSPAERVPDYAGGI